MKKDNTTKTQTTDTFLSTLKNSFASSYFKPTDPELDFLKQYFKYFSDKTQLSIAMVNGDTATFAGVKNEKDSLVIVQNQDSVFDIGSITKVFTSILLSKYINEGLVKQNDPIKNHFEFPLKQSNLDGKEITLEHLANHTSGLPRIDMNLFYVLTHFSNPYKNHDEKRLKNYLRNKMKLSSIPGAKYTYSNLGTGLLGYILCQKTAKTYEQLLQENIFVPLGMKNSTSDPHKIQPEFVKGLNIFGGFAKSWTNTDITAGAGAIKSTCKDLSTFILANLGKDEILEFPTKKTFSIKDSLGVGLGWHISYPDGDKTIFWHNGGTGGYRSCLAIDKVKKKGVAVLSNISPFHEKKDIIDKICFKLLE